MSESSFGARLVALREEARLTQHDLSRLSGVSQANISRFERDQREPMLSTLEKLASALGVSPRAFFEDK